MFRRLFLVNVLPGSQLVAAPGERRPTGYFQRFGITGDSEEEMLGSIAAYVHEDLGGTIVEVDNQGEPDFEDLDSEIRNVVGDVVRKGFWYISGRAFYLNEESDNSKVPRPN